MKDLSFCCSAVDVFTFLGYCVALGGHLQLAFRDNVSTTSKAKQSSLRTYLRNYYIPRLLTGQTVRSGSPE
jgi:hypothetical protein